MRTAMRSPSIALTEYDELSSPDPLASPSIEVNDITSSPSKRRSSAARTRNQSRSSSFHGNKTASIVQSIPVSPSRTITEQTMSPWKIRVTVEAEPEESYMGTMQTITRTMKVPLKQEESSPLDQVHLNRQNHKPNPSANGNSSAKNRRRSVTPSGRRRRQSVTDLDIVVLGDEDDGDEWVGGKKKTSPRKKVIQKITKASENGSSETNLETQQDNSSRCDEGHQTMHSDSPELREIDLNRVSVRQRAGSVKQKNSADEIHSEEPLPTTEHSDSVVNAKAVGNRKVSTNSTRSYPTPSPTPSGQVDIRSVETEEAIEPESVEGLDTIMESEGFTMIDLDTIPSVRQLRSSPSDETGRIAMPDREGTVQRSLPTQQNHRDVRNSAAAKPFPSYLAMADDESDISSSLPSSPPVSTSIPGKLRAKLSHSALQVPSSGPSSRLRQVTPISYSSPRLPSPPRPAPIKERSTPDSAKIVKAGLILQGALDPKKSFTVPVQEVMPVQSVPTEKVLPSAPSSSAELFDGFDSNTQRELRAGLRFGEELAKRQKDKSTTSITHKEPKLSDVVSPVWRGEHGVQRTPVLHTSQEHSTNVKSGPLPEAVSYPKLGPTDIIPESTLLAPSLQRDIDRETLWQRERDAVVKQIEQATPGKVIIIDSDSEDEDLAPTTHEESDGLFDGEDGDIWLAEAKDASSSPHSHQESPTLPEQAKQNQADRDTAVIEKPRRSLIPSPWKRGEQVHNVGNESTILTAGDGESAMSGLFWKQSSDESEDLRFGAGELKIARKELRKSGSTAFGNRTGSGSFDVSKMMGTPNRIKESLDKPKPKQIQQPSPLSSPDNRQHDDGSDEQNFPEEDEDEDDSTFGPPQTVPVNFNDSTASEIATPLQQVVTPPSPNLQRPPTPRSAMKGTRQSFGMTAQQDNSIETSDQARRRVVWAKRSSCVDEDWVESSRSIRSDHLTPVSSDQSVEERIADQELTEDLSHLPEQSDTPAASKIWLNWLTNNKPEQQPESSVTSPREDVMPQHDGSDDSLLHEAGEEWQSTARNPHETSSSIHTTKQKPHKSRKATQLPSYLLPPSYPSDPTLKSPLTTTSGDFTTPHFRTLHIIYRKSQRPRFHAPKLKECRPEIRNLVTSKWQIHIDEEKAGLGGFTFKIREVEARVLERFCREIEFGVLTKMMNKGCLNDENIMDVESLVESLLDSKRGIWSGNINHGSGVDGVAVRWDWSCDMLATWLGRIVIGEVVRSEEFGGK